MNDLLSELFRTVARMKADSFTEKEHHHRRFLVIVMKFTEHHFYFCRRLLGECL